MVFRARVAAIVLAVLAPVGLLGVGGVAGAFTDTATVSGVTVGVATVPTVEPVCTQSGGGFTRNATISWPDQGAAFRYALTVYEGQSVIETRDMGAATSWAVTNGYGTGLGIGTHTLRVRVTVRHASSGWAGPASPTGVGFWATSLTLDEGC